MFDQLSCNVSIAGTNGKATWQANQFNIHSTSKLLALIRVKRPLLSCLALYLLSLLLCTVMDWCFNIVALHDGVLICYKCVNALTIILSYSSYLSFIKIIIQGLVQE